MFYVTFRTPFLKLQLHCVLLTFVVLVVIFIFNLLCVTQLFLAFKKCTMCNLKTWKKLNSPLPLEVEKKSCLIVYCALFPKAIVVVVSNFWSCLRMWNLSLIDRSVWELQAKQNCEKTLVVETLFLYILYNMWWNFVSNFWPINPETPIIFVQVLTHKQSHADCSESEEKCFSVIYCMYWTTCVITCHGNLREHFLVDHIQIIFLWASCL